MARLAFFLLAAIVAYGLGETYIERLPHHAGYVLVPVYDELGATHSPPRHTILIVIDGLGRDAAEKLEIVRRLRERGQCRITDVGTLTVSRPVYALISTGLEADRTGSRNNDETSPLAAESIWQLASRAGRRVTAISPEPFWQQLFPDGFSEYQLAPGGADAFARVELADLTLIHTLYVDEAGHAHGAASPEYGKAAARADRESIALLDRIDFDRDLIVLTADHGHMSYGGHGGPQEQVKFVLTCFAGRGVRQSNETARMDARSIAPLMALLSGLPFPKHMRALEDDLDVLFELADGSQMPADYLSDRRQAIERFRDENRRQIGSWSEMYRTEHRKQQIKLGAVLAAIGLAIALFLRRRSIGSAILTLVSWTLILGGTGAAFVWMRKSFDFTAINTRADFVRAGFSVCIAVAAVSILAQMMLIDRRRVLADQSMLVGIVLGACLAHIIAFGWPIGFPLPSAELFFFPFLAPIFLVVHAAIGVVLVITDPAGALRAPP